MTVSDVEDLAVAATVETCVVTFKLTNGICLLY
jgi:hypothetical protein